MIDLHGGHLVSHERPEEVLHLSVMERSDCIKCIESPYPEMDVTVRVRMGFWVRGLEYMSSVIFILIYSLKMSTFETVGH